MLWEVEEADREGTEHKKASDKDKLVLLCKAILHGIPHDQRRYHKQENEVDDDKNGSYPFSVNNNIIAIN